MRKEKPLFVFLLTSVLLCKPNKNVLWPVREGAFKVVVKWNFRQFGCVDSCAGKRRAIWSAFVPREIWSKYHRTARFLGGDLLERGSLVGNIWVHLLLTAKVTLKKNFVNWWMVFPDKFKLQLKFQVLFCPHAKLWCHGIWSSSSCLTQFWGFGGLPHLYFIFVDRRWTYSCVLLSGAAVVTFISFSLCVEMGKFYLVLEVLKERWGRASLGCGFYAAGSAAWMWETQWCHLTVGWLGWILLHVLVEGGSSSPQSPLFRLQIAQ